MTDDKTYIGQKLEPGTQGDVDVGENLLTKSYQRESGTRIEIEKPQFLPPALSLSSTSSLNSSLKTSSRRSRSSF